MKVVAVLCLSCTILNLTTARYLNTEELHRNRRAAIRNRYRSSIDPTQGPQPYSRSSSAGATQRDLHLYPDQSASAYPGYLHRGQLTSSRTYGRDRLSQSPTGTYQREVLSSQSRYSASPLRSSDPSSARDVSRDQSRQELSSLSSLQNLYKSRVSGGEALTSQPAVLDPSHPDSGVTSAKDVSSLSSVQDLYRSSLTSGSKSSPLVSRTSPFVSRSSPLIQPGKATSALSYKQMYQNALSAGANIYRSRTRGNPDSSYVDKTPRKTFANPSNIGDTPYSSEQTAVVDPTHANSQPSVDPSYSSGQTTVVDPTYSNSQPLVDPSYPSGQAAVVDPTYSNSQAPVDPSYSSGQAAVVDPTYSDSQPPVDPSYSGSQTAGGEIYLPNKDVVDPAYPNGQPPLDTSYPKTAPKVDTGYSAGVDPVYPDGSTHVSTSSYQAGPGVGKKAVIDRSSSTYTGSDTTDSGSLGYGSNPGPSVPGQEYLEPSHHGNLKLSSPPSYAPTDPQVNDPIPVGHDHGPLDSHTNNPGLSDPNVGPIDPTLDNFTPISHDHGSLDPHANNPGFSDPNLGPMDPTLNNRAPISHDHGPLDPHANKPGLSDPNLEPIDPTFNNPAPANPDLAPIDPRTNNPGLLHPKLRSLVPTPNNPAPARPDLRVVDPHIDILQPSRPAPGPLSPGLDTPQLTDPRHAPVDPTFNNPLLGRPLPTPQAFVEIGGPTVEGPIAADLAPSPPRPVDPMLPVEPLPVEAVPDVLFPRAAPLRNPLVEGQPSPDQLMFRNQPDTWVWGDRITGQLVNFNPEGTPL